jgi:fluoroacetyl-CoA thioesterase
MTEPEIPLGAEGRHEFTVGPSHLASVLAPPGESLPPVFATASMVALMEIAAMRILAPHLAPGQESVGVLVNFAHTAATPPGMKVEAVATYRGRVGKFHEFDVVASDEAGEIGRGVHRRAVVDRDRLVRGSEIRRGTSPRR